MPPYTTLQVSVSDGLATICFCRPDKLNSFVLDQYKELTRALRECDDRDDVRALLLTAQGKYFSSGHDLKSQLSVSKKVLEEGGDLQEFSKKLIWETSYEMVEAFIHLKKPLVVGVNGPAFGISVTTMALADVIYASETATFETPFMRLGLCAEGCSSVVFPQIMGRSVANEMLLMGRRLDAKEAKEYKFVSDVFSQAVFRQEVEKRAKMLASLPPEALMQTKKLVRDIDRRLLSEVNERELTLLAERFAHPECAEALMKFMKSQGAKKGGRAKL